MPSLRRSVLHLGWLLGLLAAMTSSASADVVLTLDDANPTVTIPSSELDFVFTGTLKLDPGFTAFSAQLENLFQGGNPPELFGDFSNFPYAGADTGGGFVGGLFHFEIDPTSAPGFYDQAFGGGPVLFTVIAQDANGDQETGSVAFTVTLVQGVPEPSSLVLASCGLVALIGFGRYRRSRPGQPATSPE